jgi:hypothetical protein
MRLPLSTTASKLLSAFADADADDAVPRAVVLGLRGLRRGVRGVSGGAADDDDEVRFALFLEKMGAKTFRADRTTSSTVMMITTASGFFIRKAVSL